MAAEAKTGVFWGGAEALEQAAVMPDDAAHHTMNGKTSKGRLLEQFAVRQSLVLVTQLHTWREQAPDAKIEDLLARHHQSISEHDWMEEIASLPGVPPVFPVGERPRIPKAACSSQGRRLTMEMHAVVMQQSPVLVAGVLNPYMAGEVRDMLASLFPGTAHEIVLITPHAFVRLASLVERDACEFSGDWGEEPHEWATQVGYDPDTCPDNDAIIDELWRENIMVLPPHQTTAVAEIPGVDGVLQLRRCPLHIWVAAKNPRAQSLRDQLMQVTGRTPIVLATGPREYERLKSLLTTQTGGVEKDAQLHVQSWGTATGAALLNTLLGAAIDMGASDIHLDPKTDRVRVRFRIDNTLYEQSPLKNVTYTELLRAIKIQGRMQQDVTGRIQDGAGWIEHNGIRYDIRYGITVVEGGGDAVVARIFSSTIPDMGSLGLSILETKTLKWFLEQESGMIVLSGPTGSGKTTTLYSLCREIDDPSIDIVTIEQPVEKHFPNAKQISVREDGHLTFTSALRSVLRHDPDVILVGEIRDAEGCSKALEAALTGHLVMTTTHANDAVGVIERLSTAFGAERHTLADAVRLTVAQRLVGRLCRFCKEIREVRPEDVEHFPSVDVARPIIAERRGCPACRWTGYIGRMVVMEMLPLDDAVKAMVVNRAPSHKIAEYARVRGYETLTRQAAYLMLTGEIPPEAARAFIRRPLV